MVKKLRLLHMVTLYNTYTRYTHAHCQEFIAVKFLRGLVVIVISKLLDLRKNFGSYGILLSCYNYITFSMCIVHGFDATELKISEDAVATIRVFRLFVKGNTTGISPTRTTLPGIISSVPETAKGIDKIIIYYNAMRTHIY